MRTGLKKDLKVSKVGDDHDGARAVDDDNFIDDTGVDPADRYGSDNEARSPSRLPQAEEGEEDDEIKDMFKMGKRKKKTERSVAEGALLVENVMAELEVTAKEDAELNRQSKPAINKLNKLPLLTEVLSKCYTVAYLEDRKYSKLAPFGGFAFIAAWTSLAF